MAKIKSYRVNRRNVFDYVIVSFLFVLCIVTVYPLWSVLIISLNEPVDGSMGGIWLLPRKWTLSNYLYLSQASPEFPNALLVSVARTVLGAPASVLFTAAAAYALSKKYIRGHKVYMGMLLASMYIGGGMIPFFLVIRAVGLYQNFLVYIIPALFSNFYAIVMMTSFKSIPGELEESVRIDGGNDLVIFFNIILPVSMPVLAAIALFFAVGQWNAWFDTLLYGGQKLLTLQALLVQILRKVAQMSSMATKGGAVGALTYQPTYQSISTTCMMVTAIPIMVVYPFLQKYFVKGMMIGSLKG